MKLPQRFTIYDLRFTIGKKSSGSAVASRRAGVAANRQSQIVNRKSEGIALVITLIMLSVTLVMAIAFLALSRRERASVSTVTDTSNARLAADSALAAAQSQIMANLLATNSFLSPSNSLYNFGLVVSTNYINGNGFQTGIADPTNVNYFYTNGGQLSTADFIQNVANLQFLPRVPVFIQTNGAGSNDFRYYLDLNRNGAFDDSGNVPNVEINSSGGIDTNGLIAEVGDPQWIGQLARPDTTHSPNNQFVSRYAYFAMPIANGLDINAIHNQALSDSGNPVLPTNSVTTGFFRNQGVGSWEINLAAFLADLNTNQWDSGLNDYEYREPGNNPNEGFAFVDALSILSYRYGGTYNSLATADNVLANAANVFPNDNIDGYSDGPLQLTTTNIIESSLPDKPGQPWVGADNTNKFYDLTSDLFDPTKSSVAFTNRLLNADNGVSTYDRYTFSRLLSQLGTDSDPDDGKMNLNYSNVLVTYDAHNLASSFTVIPGAETNEVPWSATNFFSAAADQMLRYYSTNWFAASPSNYLATYYGITNTYYYVNAANEFVTNDATGFGLTNNILGTNTIPSFGITNIPVYVNGQFVYSSAVNRVLQLAANIYDASTNSFYPSVFRPIFVAALQNGYTNVYINGYQGIADVTGTADSHFTIPVDVTALVPGVNYYSSGINVYGVPWIIGAKKGFPSFNKFGMQSTIQVTRKLQVKRSTIPTVLNSTTFLTNQLLAFSINNSINAECWNSYSNAYQRPIQIYALDTISMQITNNVGALDTHFFTNQISSNFVVSPWPGYANPANSAVVAMSFTNPISSTLTLLTNSDFYFGTAPPGLSGFIPDLFNNGWESNKYDFPFPQFGLLTTNRLQLYMLDGTHVIDYVQFGGPQPTLNITATIESNNPAATGYGVNMWSTNVNTSGEPYGILSQMDASLQPINANNGTGYWADNPTTEAQIDSFALFMGLTEPYPSVDLGSASLLGVAQSFATNYVVQVPFTPTVTISQYTSWQANDPLVHYLSSDLNFFGTEAVSQAQTGVQTWYTRIGYSGIHAPSYTVVNDRYQPWGVAMSQTTYQSSFYNFNNAYNLIYKDPLVLNSDSWDFPTNVYPTVGWLGRVHRGTPWQTVYLKAENVLHDIPPGGTIDAGTNTWSVWTGDVNLYDSANSAPLADRMLFDLFTTRFNDNATLGTLSVNQNHLAAWSALFSGMVVVTNATLMPSRSGFNFSLLPIINNWAIIQPAGPSGLNSYLGDLVTNINNQRAVFTNTDGLVGSFEHKGDILSTAALTEQSPFLNLSSTNQLKYGISDEVYEWLPQQMMGLLRVAPLPRYVVYAYGQALRPAPNGLVTGGGNFGLVTNYQVVAESAVRAIVSVQRQVKNTSTGPVTNYTTRVESYNVLPPN